MTRHEIETRVREILQRSLGDEAADAPSTTTLGDLGADSLDRLEISLALEDAFGIYLTDEEGERVRTVGDAIALAARKLGVPA